ncbi:ankyrin repeat domain-containing protein [Viridibacillus arvi]|uniref:Ankyrin n=2 Tax=Viridibacillus arvi TaxID=263475 RepID=A0A0M0LGK7_9BACL|nr:ankyrin repeat domain-containing protein [Viridibacillus arvi]KOO50189.1 ankyrin [Viridibacillus arvi]
MSLFEAVEKQDSNAVKKALKSEQDINTQDSKGRTALMIATYNNDVKSAKFLIEAGADVNIQDDMQNSPFLYAGAEGYLDILKLTTKAGADPKITNRYGGIALIPASEHGYVDVVKFLLTETNSDVNHINNLGWTALLEAIILGDGGKKQQETVRILLEHGANPNLADRDGVTPLEHAEKLGYKEIEKLLRKARY